MLELVSERQSILEIDDYCSADMERGNDLEPFSEVNPTAENIAAYFFRELSDRLNSATVRVSSVVLWETDRACARYTED